MAEQTPEYPKDTLGYHRAMAVAILGSDSAAVVYLDKKIAESPLGPAEPVITPEPQVVYLLMQIHQGANQEGSDD